MAMVVYAEFTDSHRLALPLVVRHLPLSCLLIHLVWVEELDEWRPVDLILPAKFLFERDIN